MISKIDAALFSLFHHNVFYDNDVLNIDTLRLHKLAKGKAKTSFREISESIYSIIRRNLGEFSDKDISLTLTGGMDSRVILAALLKAGVKPNCVTFGNPGSKDVFFSQQIANSFGLPFHNVCSQLPDRVWYERWVIETIKRDKGNAHLHRAHRTAAIAEHAKTYRPKIMFTGHMGGEAIRGDAYTDYLTSSFFECVNEKKMGIEEAARKTLNDYFIHLSDSEFGLLIEQILKLQWMQNDKEANLIYFLYELDAKIHHSQDLRIYNTFIPKVVPVFLEQDYLEKLFSSPYHFLIRSDGIRSRLSMPLLPCKIIEELYPPLLDFPFANGFKPKEFLSGMWNYIPAKLFRDRLNKGKFRPTFSYGNWYIEYLEKNLPNVESEIWDIYDKEQYLKAFRLNTHKRNEGYWHKFTNPVFFDLTNKYNKGILK